MDKIWNDSKNQLLKEKDIQGAADQKVHFMIPKRIELLILVAKL